VAFSLPINITAENLYPPVHLRFDLMKVSVVLAIFTKRARVPTKCLFLMYVSLI
jgi:hypothetical protein